MAAIKRARVVLAQPAAGAPASLPPLFSRAPGPVRGTGDEAAYRASLRYRALLQDYQELVKETQAKKRRLHMERLRKLRLLAEIKFLRKRYKSMSENPSQAVVCRVRNPAIPPAPWATAWAGDSQQQLVHAAGSSSRSQPLQRRQDGSPRASPVIDLNEACEPGYEEVEIEERYSYRAPLGINKSKRYLIEGDAPGGPSEVRMPVFWDVQNPSGRSGKRKISWQDQLALRV
ncbi:hypothetical protein BS78_K077200 [Paspalum vaginatum]|uniref:Uncharacterized protein n=1 Tax=Paspalum vaginatum TaxID=158149 RepID=A0A9W7XA22_9POAL|nr:hypothetical protein BS78_K077200 [Paspalum vaginatum]